MPRPASGWSPVIVATGPLTSDALSADISAFVGADHLYFYDAISPIVLADSIDIRRCFGRRGGIAALRRVRAVRRVRQVRQVRECVEAAAAWMMGKATI